jgi:hypothetical protein
MRFSPLLREGNELDHDRRPGFVVTEQGVVVIAKAELPGTFTSRE